MDLVGRVIDGRYSLAEWLGQGPTGVVYRAQDLSLHRDVVLKLLRRELWQNADAISSFEREQGVAMRLRHPGVVAIRATGNATEGRYVVSELALGPGLDDMLGEPLPAQRVTRMIGQLLDGLAHIHGVGLVHGRLKPQNIIIEHGGRASEVARIVDVALGTLHADTGLETCTAFLAPEQRAGGAVDHRADLFAIGAVAYNMLSGFRPSNAGDDSSAEVASLRVRVPWLKIDPLLDAFACWLMRRLPADRPATATAAREVLDLIQRDRVRAAVKLGLVPASEVAPSWAETTRLEVIRVAAPASRAETARLPVIRDVAPAPRVDTEPAHLGYEVVAPPPAKPSTRRGAKVALAVLALVIVGFVGHALTSTHADAQTQFAISELPAELAADTTLSGLALLHARVGQELVVASRDRGARFVQFPRARYADLRLVDIMATDEQRIRAASVLRGIERDLH